ncbi:fumarylacetoacetate hydrolase family protein [Demetria terragena]|uniref:fumarylacetoacetate hydrolase family protein n=1 Tax=Demetria terragena TaxID=63959 RepID=UPI00035DCEAF|nr:fumarylacetoacetate hydrolase family protein [Demetria terragena]
MILTSYLCDGVEQLVVHTKSGDVFASDLGGPSTLAGLIEAGPDATSRLQTSAATYGGPPANLEGAQLLASVPKPTNVIAIGRNYAEHAAEENADKPAAPEIFLKHTSSQAAHLQDIVWDPTYTKNIDWEAELGVVIGSAARNVSVDTALDHILGYTVFNDVSARDIQFADLQWARGKSLETFGPCGPSIVTADEVPDPQNLAIRCLLNDEVMQESHTSLMYFPVAEIISYCSRAFTLQPGDLIVTGTPGGVGAFRTPPVWMQDGDTVVVEVDGVGRLENRCVTQKA